MFTVLKLDLSPDIPCTSLWGISCLTFCYEPISTILGGCYNAANQINSISVFRDQITLFNNGINKYMLERIWKITIFKIVIHVTVIASVGVSSWTHSFTSHIGGIGSSSNEEDVEFRTSLLSSSRVMESNSANDAHDGLVSLFFENADKKNGDVVYNFVREVLRELISYSVYQLVQYGSHSFNQPPPPPFHNKMRHVLLPLLGNIIHLSKLYFRSHHLFHWSSFFVLLWPFYHIPKTNHTNHHGNMT